MKADKGFTLVEILLVVIIVGIVIAMAAPNFSKGYSRFQINKTADDLLQCSRWAQTMAIGQERTYALSFASDHRSYRLLRAKVDDQSDVQDSFEPVPGGLGRMHHIPDAVHVELTQTDDSKETDNNDRIEFYPDGTIEQAAIQLVSSGQKTVLSSAQVRGMMTKVDRE